MPLFHLSALLYVLAVKILLPCLCAYIWLLAGKARAKKLVAFSRWLRPAAFASTFTAVAVLLRSAMGSGPLLSYTIATIVSLSTVAALITSLIAFLRLGQMLTDLPIGSEQAAIRAADEAHATGVWPPPPLH